MYEERLLGEIPTFETRRKSNEQVDRNKRYSQITEILKESNIPLTAKEIAVRMYVKGYTPNAERNQSSPRLTELMIKGIVEPVGKKICTYTNRKVTVFKIRGDSCET